MAISNWRMAKRMAAASALALACSKALDACNTARSCSFMAALACSRCAVLRWKALSMGWRNASHSFCSRRRSSTMVCASACQRCCKALTASTRSTSAEANCSASAIKAWRRMMLACCTASMGARAAFIASRQAFCISAKAFSLMWPASRQRFSNCCKWRATAFQSGPCACARAQACNSSIKAWRWALWAAASARTFSSHCSTILWAWLQARSKRFHSPWLGKPP